MLDELAASDRELPEVTDYQVYAGTVGADQLQRPGAPVLPAQRPELGDIQVNLVDKHHRDRKSHEIALAVRPALAEIGREHGASVKVVEVPPGPPVQAPLVAEIYGPFDDVQQAAGARRAQGVRRHSPTSSTWTTASSPRTRAWSCAIDRQKAALLGVSQAEAVQALAAGLGGLDATYVQAGRETYPIPVRLELGVPDKARPRRTCWRCRCARGAARGSPLSEIAIVEEQPWDDAIYHKDLLPVILVTGDVVGRLDSPLYGMFEMVGALRKDAAGGPRAASSASSARRTTRTGPRSSGTASGRSPTRPSATWGSPTRWAWC